VKWAVNRWEKGNFTTKKLWRRGRDEHEGVATTRYTGKDLEQNGVLEMECRLGEGGMGYVWKARNKEDGTAVAIKVAKEVRSLKSLKFCCAQNLPNFPFSIQKNSDASVDVT